MRRGLLGVAAALLFAAPAGAADYTVIGTGDAPDAYCEGTTCQSLRAAVNAANAAADADRIVATGAGYQLLNGPLTISNPVTIEGNGANATTVAADTDGGRVFEIVNATPVELNDLALQGGSGDYGGSLLAQSSQVTLTRLRIYGGSAQNGAGVANRNGSLTINESLIHFNLATTGDGNGGGVMNFGSGLGPAALTIRNSTIAGNFAKIGGGLASIGAGNTVTTTGTTIGQNRSSEGAGGIHIDAGSTWTSQLTLVGDNLREPLTPSNCTGVAATSNGWNVENFEDCGFTHTDDRGDAGDVRMSTSLDDHGGPTATLELLPGSPALSVTATCPGTDQRGITRPKGSGCDAGAFESELVPGPPPTITSPTSPMYRSVREVPFSGTAQPGETVNIYLGFALQQTTEANAQGAWSTEIELPDADGTYTYEARTPTSTSGATVEITLDRADPETTIDSKPANPSTSPTAAFTYSSSEPNSLFSCRFMGPGHDDPTFSVCGTDGIQYTNLANGEYKFDVRATDRAGNTDDTEATYTFEVNAGPAGPPITTPAAGARVRPTFILQGTSTPNANIVVTLGTMTVGSGAADPQGLWAVSVGTLPAGEQTLSVQADGGPATTRAFLVDAAPTATIDQRPPATINRGEAAFTYSADEPGTFRCRLVGPGRDDNEAPCPNAGISYTGLADGDFEFRVRAVDQTGEGDTAVAAFTVNSALIAAPDVSAPATEPTAATFTFSTAQADRTFRCRLEGPGQDGAFAACASPQRYPGLQAGAYRFTVRSADQFGNFADSVREFSVTGPAVVAQQTPTPTPTPRPTEPPVPQPERSETVVVRPTGGKVLIQIPPSKEFVELKSIDDIPLGAIIDAKNGRVQLRFESEPGKVQTAVFYGGIFQVRQVGRILDLKLTEALAACPKKKGGKASTAQSKKKPKKRKLWGDGKGSFRTSGKYSAATVRGTKWLVEDSCAGTLTRVVTGVVAVKDRKKTILVRAGKRYLAKAR